MMALIEFRIKHFRRRFSASEPHSPPSPDRLLTLIGPMPGAALVFPKAGA